MQGPKVQKTPLAFPLQKIGNVYIHTDSHPKKADDHDLYPSETIGHIFRKTHAHKQAQVVKQWRKIAQFQRRHKILKMVICIGKKRQFDRLEERVKRLGKRWEGLLVEEVKLWIERHLEKVEKVKDTLNAHSKAQWVGEAVSQLAEATRKELAQKIDTMVQKNSSELDQPIFQYEDFKEKEAELENEGEELRQSWQDLKSPQFIHRWKEISKRLQRSKKIVFQARMMNCVICYDILNKRKNNKLLSNIYANIMFSYMQNPLCNWNMFSMLAERRGELEKMGRTRRS